VQLFWLYYVIPMLTWGMFINQLRTMAEHYSRGEFGHDAGIPDVLLTRDVLPSLFDRAFVTTRAVNYHLTHHLFPAVPFYNLARLQRCLKDNTVYRASAHVTHGYHRFLMELLTKKLPTSTPA
jgi:fatty acid desaturase